MSHTIPIKNVWYFTLKLNFPGFQDKSKENQVQSFHPDDLYLITEIKRIGTIY